jgi:hypothetical protein
MNDFGQLRWTADKPSDDVIFLDLHISIGPNRKILTKTYQKEMNLFLYIPPLSAHPEGVLKGLVFGNLRWFWTQNPDINDYITITYQFFQHLLDRGHNATHLAHLFMSATSKLDAESKMMQVQLTMSKKITQAEPKDTLFFHLEHHPRGIPRHTIRYIYKESLEPHSGFK